jgi:hypothetical protein
VVDSPAGEASTEVRFPYDGLTLSNKLQALQIALLRSGGRRRSVPSSDDRAVQELGHDLFQTLFSGEVASRLHVSRIIASREGRGIRIKLRMSEPELLALPWEYLYDETRGDYLALGVGTPVVRYVPLPQLIRPLEVTPPIRVLGMIAAPRDLGEIDAARERQRLEVALGPLRQRELVALEWVPGETWSDLQQALWRGPWHVFHFIGHGAFSRARGTGLVFLSGDDGMARELSATDFARLLADHDPLRLAVLNSCDTAQGSQADVFSSTATTLVRRGTPAVVAMQFQITDDAAVQFSRVFYAAVAHGMPIDAAVAEARKSVALQVANSYEWGTPVLFMRSRDGVLFRVPEFADSPRAEEEVQRQLQPEPEHEPITATSGAEAGAAASRAATAGSARATNKTSEPTGAGQVTAATSPTVESDAAVSAPIGRSRALSFVRQAGYLDAVLGAWLGGVVGLFVGAGAWLAFLGLQRTELALAIVDLFVAVGTAVGIFLRLRLARVTGPTATAGYVFAIVAVAIVLLNPIISQAPQPDIATALVVFTAIVVPAGIAGRAAHRLRTTGGF